MSNEIVICLLLIVTDAVEESVLHQKWQFVPKVHYEYEFANKQFASKWQQTAVSNKFCSEDKMGLKWSDWVLKWN